MAAADDSATRWQQFFREADVNGDGLLTFDELWSVLRKHRADYSREQLKSVFRLADTDGDNKISLQEWLITMDGGQKNVKGDGLLKLLFRSIDKDNDGEIDCRELQFMFVEMGQFKTEDELRRFISLHDRSGKGTLTFDEFKRAFPHLNRR